MAGSNSLCSVASHLDLDIDVKESDSQLSIDTLKRPPDDGSHCFEPQKQIPEHTTLFCKQEHLDNRLSQTNRAAASLSQKEFVNKDGKIMNFENVNGFSPHKNLDHGTIPNGVSKELLEICDGKVVDDVPEVCVHDDIANDVSHNTCKCVTNESYDTVCGDKSNVSQEIPSQSNISVEELANRLASTSIAQDCLNLSCSSSDVISSITYVVYESEKQMPDIMRLITKDLSEPYSIYTYRYFIHNWPKLCFLAMDGEDCVGAIVCKLDVHKKMVRRGYIAMLAVDSRYRRRQIGSTLVTKAIEAMIRDDCDEVVLETEITNQGALHLYQNLGFVRDKRLFRYYLNGVDALRLKLWLR